MGFFSNLFKKKEKEPDIMKILAESKKRTESSVNYQFCFAALKPLFFSEKTKIGEIYGDEEAVRNLCLRALLFLKEVEKMDIPVEFTKMPIYFKQTENRKSIVKDLERKHGVLVLKNLKALYGFI